MTITILEIIHREYTLVLYLCHEYKVKDHCFFTCVGYRQIFSFLQRQPYREKVLTAYLLDIK